VRYGLSGTVFSGGARTHTQFRRYPRKYIWWTMASFTHSTVADFQKESQLPTSTPVISQWLCVAAQPRIGLFAGVHTALASSSSILAMVACVRCSRMMVAPNDHELVSRRKQHPIQSGSLPGLSLNTPRYHRTPEPQAYRSVNRAMLLCTRSVPRSQIVIPPSSETPLHHITSIHIFVPPLHLTNHTSSVKR
jgi:hypothetical protein